MRRRKYTKLSADAILDILAKLAYDKSADFCPKWGHLDFSDPKKIEYNCDYDCPFFDADKKTCDRDKLYLHCYGEPR